MDNVYGSPVLIDDIEKQAYENLMVVSPDIGGVVRARAVAKQVGDLDLAIIDKRRPQPNQAEVMNLIGDVSDRTCLVVDDMVDTAGTLCGAAEALLEQGATKVSAYASHGVLSGPAAKRLKQSSLSELVITDSISQPGKVTKSGKVRIISIAPLMGEAITRIYDARSISSLYE